MLKVKYLHRKRRKKDNDEYWYNSRYKRVPKYKYKYSNDSYLPKREPMGKYYRYNYLDFNPLYEFLETKIGKKWDEVYSEILTKIKPKFRYQLEESLEWMIDDVCYTENFLPYGKWSRLLVDSFFIDEKRILRNYKSKEELYLLSKKKIRQEKIKQLLESQNE